MGGAGVAFVILLHAVATIEIVGVNRSHLGTIVRLRMEVGH